MDKQGYVLIRVGKNHPWACPNGYIREHVLVVCSTLGRRLRTGEVIHHINETRTDNRIENLKVMSLSEHNRLHNLNKRRDSKGRFLPRPLGGREHNEFPKENHDA